MKTEKFSTVLAVWPTACTRSGRPKIQCPSRVPPAGPPVSPRQPGPIVFNRDGGVVFRTNSWASTANYPSHATYGHRSDERPPLVVNETRFN